MKRLGLAVKNNYRAMHCIRAGLLGRSSMVRRSHSVWWARSNPLMLSSSMEPLELSEALEDCNLQLEPLNGCYRCLLGYFSKEAHEIRADDLGDIGFRITASQQAGRNQQKVFVRADRGALSEAV